MAGTGHEGVQLLHEQLLKRNTEDIKELQQEFYGVPHQIKELEKRVAELVQTNTMLNASMQDFLRRIEDKFQTKELCLNNVDGIVKDFETYKVENDKRVDYLERRFDRAIIALLITLVGIIGFVSKYGFDLFVRSLIKQ